MIGVSSVGQLNEIIESRKTKDFVEITETLQNNKLAHIAEQIKNKKDVKVILIAGPSSSGKTTSAKKLSMQLRVVGYEPYVISLDDYYVGRDKTPRGKDGKLDFECLEALDVPLLNDILLRLFAGEEVELPSYNFKTGDRIYNGKRLKLNERSILILEGIHGLNDKLTPQIDPSLKFKIYLSALTQLNLDDHHRIPTPDNRLLRRIVRDRIALLKKKLETIDKQMATQRGNRGALVRVALIGYTNVGKSTLMNLISKSDVFAEDKLFATLDTTVRKVVIGNLPFLLSDTVGFIRKLPTELIESFKSTLDEVRDADLLLHVVDISHPNFEDHIASVNQILGEIKSINKPTIMVFNKIDAYTHLTIEDDDLMTEKTSRHFSLEEWKQTWMNRMNGDAIFISAINKENIQEFREKVYHKVREIHVTRFPYNNFLYPEIVIEEEANS